MSLMPEYIDQDFPFLYEDQKYINGDSQPMTLRGTEECEESSDCTKKDINLSTRKRRRDNKYYSKDEIKHIRKEKNREKAQVFRQRKKEYVGTLEKKVEELEAKVCDLTAQIHALKNERVVTPPEADLFQEFDYYGYDNYTPPVVNLAETQSIIEELCGDQEKLLFLLNTCPVQTDKKCFRYLGKMGMCMKTEILKTSELNPLETFMLESDMSPEEVKSVFQSENITKLNNAMKCVAETVIDTQKNIDKLQKLAKNVLTKIHSGFTSSQIYKMRLLSEKLKEEGQLSLRQVWNM